MPKRTLYFVIVSLALAGCATSDYKASDAGDAMVLPTQNFSLGQHIGQAQNIGQDSAELFMPMPHIPSPFRAGI